MKPCAIIMPMAGFGRRFQEGDAQVLKPFIPLCGQPFFRWALRGLLPFGPDLVRFVLRRDGFTKAMECELRRCGAKCEVVLLDQPTRGAAETLYLGLDGLDPQSVVISLDCDLYLDAPNYTLELQAMRAGTSSLDGLVPTFPSTEPRYSFVRCNERGTVLDIAEKEAISKQAVVGAYAFGSAGRCRRLAEELLAGPPPAKGEYPVSAILRRLVKEGGAVKAVPARSYCSFGTPDELPGATRFLSSLTAGR